MFRYVLIGLVSIFAFCPVAYSVQTDNRVQTDSRFQASKLSPTIAPHKQKYAGSPVFIRIFKEQEIVELFVKQGHQYVLLDSYPICQFSGGLGPKKIERDLKSPEGFYQIKADSLNPNSRFHLSFDIGYPNEFDKSNGYTGNLLMVHGGCISQGCYAIGNNHIEEVYYFVQQALLNGQKQIDIHIFPFQMTDKNMEIYQSSSDHAFWQQLKPGYDYFEKHKNPPFIYIGGGKYFVSAHLPDQ